MTLALGPHSASGSWNVVTTHDSASSRTYLWPLPEHRLSAPTAHNGTYAWTGGGLPVGDLTFLVELTGLRRVPGSAG